MINMKYDVTKYLIVKTKCITLSVWGKVYLLYE